MVVIRHPEISWGRKIGFSSYFGRPQRAFDWNFSARLGQGFAQDDFVANDLKVIAIAS